MSYKILSFFPSAVYYLVFVNTEFHYLPDYLFTKLCAVPRSTHVSLVLTSLNTD